MRQRVLPEPARTAQGRYLFTDDHVRLLKKIEGLKRSGSSLEQIGFATQDERRKLEERDQELPKQESERVRHVILKAATQEFLAKGYHRTRIRTIIKKAGVSPQVFYAYFPSKSRLLAESFGVMLEWSRAQTGPRAMETEDLGERLLLRISANPPALAFQRDVLALAHSSPEDEAEDRRLVQLAWAGVVKNIIADLASTRALGAGAPPVSLELLGYSLIGALHEATFRAEWGDEFDKTDVMRVHLWLWLAALAALGGETDIEARLARYEGLIQQLAGAESQAPPPIDEWPEPPLPYRDRSGWSP